MLRTVARLRDAGVSLQRIRKVLDRIRASAHESPSDRCLVTDGDAVYIVDDGRFEDALTGQRVFGVIPIGQIRQGVEADIKVLDAPTISGRRLRTAPLEPEESEAS